MTRRCADLSGHTVTDLKILKTGTNIWSWSPLSLFNRCRRFFTFLHAFDCIVTNYVNMHSIFAQDLACYCPEQFIHIRSRTDNMNIKIIKKGIRATFQYIYRFFFIRTTVSNEKNSLRAQILVTKTIFFE